jgi:hypothetical protein
MLEESCAINWRLVHGRLRYGAADIEPSCIMPGSILATETFCVSVGYLSFQAYLEYLVPKGLVIDHVYSHAEVISWHKLTGRLFPWAAGAVPGFRRNLCIRQVIGRAGCLDNRRHRVRNRRHPPR